MSRLGVVLSIVSMPELAQPAILSKIDSTISTLRMIIPFHREFADHPTLDKAPGRKASQKPLPASCACNITGTGERNLADYFDSPRGNEVHEQPCLPASCNGTNCRRISGRRSSVNTCYPETVVLVHGLWMHGVALLAQKHWLAQLGFVADTFSYPSIRRSLDENSHLLARYLSGFPGNGLNLVAHSLGGLVVLNMLTQATAPRIRRIVLMGSPCGGSHCATVLLRIPLLASVVGRSIRDASRQTHWQVPADVENRGARGERQFRPWSRHSRPAPSERRSRIG